MTTTTTTIAACTIDEHGRRDWRYDVAPAGTITPHWVDNATAHRILGERGLGYLERFELLQAAERTALLELAEGGAPRARPTGGGDIVSGGSYPVGMTSTRVEPVGELEVAERLGVLATTVHQWVYRGLMPEPRWTVSGRPAWNWPTVERWARATGRLSERP